MLILILSVFILILVYTKKECFNGNPFYQRITIGPEKKNLDFSPSNSDKIQGEGFPEKEDTISKIISLEKGYSIDNTGISEIPKVKVKQLIERFINNVNMKNNLNFSVTNIGEYEIHGADIMIPVFIFEKNKDYMKGIIVGFSKINGKYVVKEIFLSSNKEFSLSTFNSKAFNNITKENGFYTIKNKRGLTAPFITSREDSEIEVPDTNLNKKINKNNTFYF